MGVYSFRRQSDRMDGSRTSTTAHRVDENDNRAGRQFGKERWRAMLDSAHLANVTGDTSQLISNFESDDVVRCIMTSTSDDDDTVPILVHLWSLSVCRCFGCEAFEMSMRNDLRERRQVCLIGLGSASGFPSAQTSPAARMRLPNGVRCERNHGD